MLESYLRILERQGKLKGDLSWIQRTGLVWIMNRETEDEVKLERIRTENFALASNPATSGKFIQMLEAQRQKDQLLETRIEEETGMEVEWRMPTSVEEVEDVLQNLGLKMPTEP